MLNNNKHRASHWRDWLVRAATGALFIIVYSNSYAADVTGLETEDSFLGDIPIVLSATRLAQPRSDAPAAITIITREMIETSGATEIVDLMRLAPGFQVAHEPGDLFVANPVGVTYHGLSDVYARRMQVLVDGRSVYDPVFGGVRWNELLLDIDDIEQIEIIRGPNGASYGANAFLAIINIKTRHPADVRGVYTRVSAGGHNDRDVFFRYGAGTDNYDYRLSFGYKGTDAIVNQPDSRELRYLNFASEYRMGSKSKLELNLGFGSGLSQAGKISIDDPIRFSPTERNYQQLKWTYTASADSEYQLQFYRNYQLYSDIFDAVLFGLPTQLDLGNTSERSNVEFQHIYRFNKDLRTVWGLEARIDQARANDGWLYGLGAVSNQLTRAFTNVESRFAPKWIANIGAMIEDNGITGIGVSPRIALNYHIAPGRTLRGSVSRGLRNPALLEEYANSFVIAGNLVSLDTPVWYYGSTGNLMAEKITSYEIGYLFEQPGKGLSADFRLYKDYISDLIGYPANQSGLAGSTEPFNLFTNNDSATIGGFEVDLQARTSAKSRISLTYAYAESNASLSYQYNPDLIVQSSQVTPTHTVGFLGSYKLPNRVEVNLGIYYVAEMLWIDTGTVTPEYTKVDLRIARKFKTASANGTIEFIGQNLVGQYYDHENTTFLDRRYYIRIRLHAKQDK
ncbi:MAG: TonB-dependent receptor [Acidiferrobacterales bacterium]